MLCSLSSSLTSNSSHIALPGKKPEQIVSLPSSSSSQPCSVVACTHSEAAAILSSPANKHWIRWQVSLPAREIQASPGPGRQSFLHLVFYAFPQSRSVRTLLPIMYLAIARPWGLRGVPRAAPLPLGCTTLLTYTGCLLALKSRPGAYTPVEQWPDLCT